MISDLSEFNLSEKCIMLCTSAKSVLENMCTLIKTGDIKLMELSEMKENEEHLKKLLVVAEPIYNEGLQQLLNQRFYEQECFTQRLNYLRQFCQHISIEIKGKLFSTATVL